MLIVAGWIRTEPEVRDSFLQAVAPMVDATLDEPGCQEYAFSPDPLDATRVLLFELWADQEALDAHFASEHMAAWQAVRSTLGITGADIKKYVISEIGTLP